MFSSIQGRSGHIAYRQGQLQNEKQGFLPKNYLEYEDNKSTTLKQAEAQVLRSVGPRETAQVTHRWDQPWAEVLGGMILCWHQLELTNQTSDTLHCWLVTKTVCKRKEKKDRWWLHFFWPQHFSILWFCSWVKQSLPSFHNGRCWFLFMSKSCLISQSLLLNFSVVRTSEKWSA